MKSIYNLLYLASGQVEITQTPLAAQHRCHSDRYKLTLVQKGSTCLNVFLLGENVIRRYVFRMIHVKERHIYPHHHVVLLKFLPSLGKK